MFTSCSPTWRNCVAVAGLPLIQARLRLWVSMVRRRVSAWALGNSWLCSQAAVVACGVKTRVISACSAPSRTTLASARAPRASCRASSKMDLPAPVSPVRAVKPVAKSKSSACTMTKSRSVMRLSVMVGSFFRSSPIFCARWQSNSNPGGAKNARCARSGARRCGRHARWWAVTACRNWRWHRARQ